MKPLARAAVGAAAAVSVLVVGACGVFAGQVGAGPVAGLRIMVPNTPGSGYDTTARTAAKVMEEANIASNIQVFNLPGGGGTVGLQRMVNEKGNGKLAMQMGLGVVGASYVSKSKSKLSHTTPIAKLMEEASAIVVPKDSPYKTINDLVTTWKANPREVTVGGGSSLGGPDHLLPMLLAQAVGIDPKQVNFVSYDGGGELLPAIVGSKIDFGTSGLGELLDQVKAGELRVLAVTSERPIEAAKDVPTLKESGINLVFTNWRGIIGPPEITAADKQVWVDALTRMHTSEGWKAELARHGWIDSFVTGDEFGAFLAEQEKAVAVVLTQLGV